MGCNTSRAAKANEHAITQKKSGNSNATSKELSNINGSQSKSEENSKRSVPEKKDHETNPSEFVKSSNAGLGIERAEEEDGFLVRNVSSKPKDEKKVEDRKKTVVTVEKGVEDWLGEIYQSVQSKLLHKV